MKKRRILKSEKKFEIEVEKRKKRELELNKEEERNKILIHVPEGLLKYRTKFRDDRALKVETEKYFNQIKKARGGELELELYFPSKDGQIIRGELHLDYRLVNPEVIPPFVTKEDYTVGDLQNRLEKEIKAKIRNKTINMTLDEIITDEYLPEKMIEAATYTFEQLGYSVENPYFSFSNKTTTYIINKSDFKKVLKKERLAIKSYLSQILKDLHKQIENSQEKTVDAVYKTGSNIIEEVRDTSKQISEQVYNLTNAVIDTQDAVEEVRKDTEYIKGKTIEIETNVQGARDEVKTLSETIEEYKKNIGNLDAKKEDIEKLRENAKLEYASELAKEYMILNKLEDHTIETAITRVFKTCLDRAEEDGFSKTSLLDYITKDEISSFIKEAYRSA